MLQYEDHVSDGGAKLIGKEHKHTCQLCAAHFRVGLEKTNGRELKSTTDSKLEHESRTSGYCKM